jgi:enterochelin esterase-like enzyme
MAEFCFLWLSLIWVLQDQTAIIEDRPHFSKVLGENRNYRVFLPAGYKNQEKHYPVLYWFHGSGGSSKQETYKSDFLEYTSTHDLIIVNVDGTTPGGTTWDYGLAFEYDKRTQEGKPALTGMHFSKYISELIGVIDSSFRTIPDRDHRAVSGQSMGGLMAPWIASQNKDLFGCLSMFSPSPDAAMFGPEGKEVCFINSELYRSLKGLPVRITIANGDRYVQYYYEQKAKWELADLTHFEFHSVNYPDHKAVGIEEQFDFHMAEFSKSHPVPVNWHHTDPFTNFRVWNYDVSVKRNVAAFTILEKVNPDGLLVSSRSFLPDGPLIENESITITTDTIYEPGILYILTDFNRTTRNIKTTKVKSDYRGRLTFTVDGGGHALGIKKRKEGPRLFVIPSTEELYCEDGKYYDLDLILVNAGTKSSGPIRLTSSTPKNLITFDIAEITVEGLNPGEYIEMKDHFPFLVNKRDKNPGNAEFTTKISLGTSCDGFTSDTSDVFISAVHENVPAADTSDLVILDGTSRNVEIYDNLRHEITVNKITGGTGNGNSIAEPGETIEVWIRLPQGLGPADKNTFHPAFLLNAEENPFISINELRYNLKGEEYSGAANIQSKIMIDRNIPPQTTLNLWFRCESYEFSEEGFNRPIQRHKFDYCRINLNINKK